MKIRIRENSIRLRLTKPEVEEFCKTKSFSQNTPFGNATFTYTLQSKEEDNGLSAAYLNHEIIVFIPLADVEKWKNDAQVGFTNTFDTGNGIELSLKVEKDFVCLDETEEDQSENYPNPKLS